MMFATRLLVCITTLLLQLTLGQDSALVSDSSVISIVNATNFAETITTKDLILAEFVVPWCPHSKIILPGLLKAAEELKESNIDVIQINCEEEDYICAELKISYYPTLRIFKNHRLARAIDIEDDKTPEGIVNYMLKQVGSSRIHINSDEELQEILNNNEEEYIFLDNGIEALNNTLEKISSELFNSHLFVSYPNNTNATFDLGLYVPFNSTLNQTRADPIIYTGDLQIIIDNYHELSTWMKYAVLPPFTEVDTELFKAYIDTKLPLGYYFFLTKQEYEEYFDFFTALGEKYRGKMNFIGLNAMMFHNHVKFLNMREQFPLFAIHNMTNNRKYGVSQMPVEEYKALTELQKLDKDEVTQLVEQFINGTALPLIKSEEVPKNQYSNVIKLVAKSHDSYVYNSDKDVIVKYYAPWDLHSKKIQESFEELADLFAGNEEMKDKIMFAEVNMGANDIINFPITTYPTVVVYPAGQKNGPPIIHQGPKTSKFLLNFIRHEGANNLDGREMYLASHPDERTYFYAHEEEAGDNTSVEGTISIEKSNTEESTASAEEQVQHDEL